MNDNAADQIEGQLAKLHTRELPKQLRAPVLQAAHRELAAQRWDRRLAGLAATLLLVGIALNVSVDLSAPRGAPVQTQMAAKPGAIVELAVTVGEATDVQTASQFARRLAALSGAALTPQDTARMEREIQERVKNTAARKEG